jgi:hypothetical protein
VKEQQQQQYEAVALPVVVALQFERKEDRKEAGIDG